VSVARIYPASLSQSPVRPSGLPIRTMLDAVWRAIRQRSGVGKSYILTGSWAARS
jgi:hypothetical protein